MCFEFGNSLNESFNISFFNTQSKFRDLEPSQNAFNGFAVLCGFVQRYHGMKACEM